MSLSFSKLSVLLLVAAFIGGHKVESQLSCPERIEIHYYTLNGLDSRELVSSLLFAGPKDEKGQPRHAETRWHLDFKKENNVSCSVEIKIPQWEERLYSDPSLVTVWDRYMYQVGLHEWQHAKHGIEAADQIANYSNDSSGFVVKAKKRDREYDFFTKHGETEGISSQALLIN